MIERAVARIDLGALERNCERLRSELGDATELCAVVKANAYGHGDTWCAKAALKGGATWLAVAAAGEALDLLAQRGAPTILTPHDGELGRLLGIESSQVGEKRIEHARAVAQKSGAIVVLKGDDTLVVPPEGAIAVNPGGSAALATAGTGDVLSGLIGALLSKEMDPFEAACAGVFAHGRAGRIAAERIGADHVVAGDVIDALPAGLRRPE